MENEIKRYTTLPALLYLLKHRAITMLDPSSWDDSNDTHFLSQYKAKKKLKTLLALCFTSKPETYHHWHVFAGKSGGVCITFKKQEFLDAIQRGSVRCGEVQYRTIRSLKSKPPSVDELPFIKRYGFQDEQEFRVIFESKTYPRSTNDIHFPLSCIKNIHIDPWINDSLYRTIRNTIETISDCHDIKISQSSLVGNNEWKKIADGAA